MPGRAKANRPIRSCGTGILLFLCASCWAKTNRWAKSRSDRITSASPINQIYLLTQATGRKSIVWILCPRKKGRFERQLVSTAEHVSHTWSRKSLFKSLNYVHIVEISWCDLGVKHVPLRCQPNNTWAPIIMPDVVQVLFTSGHWHVTLSHTRQVGMTLVKLAHWLPKLS